MDILKDLRFAIRTIARYPWTHGAAVLSLALAIGAVITQLSVVDDLLWSPIPGVNAPERTAWLFQVRGNQVDMNSDILPVANLRHYHKNAQSFENVAWMGPRRMVLNDGDSSEELSSNHVSANFFQLMGTKPSVGRLLLPEDTAAGATRVVVLGQELYESHFGGTPDVIGKNLNIGGVKFAVVGVAPKGFFAQFSGPVPLWLPRSELDDSRASRNKKAAGVVRLKEGVTFAMANTELAAMSHAIAKVHPDTDRGLGAQAVSLRDMMTHWRPVAFALVIAALLVLAVAGANTANLLLAQATERSRELAVRQALGAGLWRLIREWCVQSALLLGCAVAIGTLLAHWATAAIVATMPQGIRQGNATLAELGIGLRPWGISVAIGCVATLLIAIIPSRQASKLDLLSTLRDGGGGVVGRRTGQWAGRALVAVQVALASALTFGATCAFDHFVSKRDVPLGFKAADVTALHLPKQGESAEQHEKFLRQLQRQIAQGQLGQPGSLALADSMPLAKQFARQTFYWEGTARPEASEMPWGKQVWVSPSYFSALNIALIDGRHFDQRDAVDGSCSVIFSRQLVNKTLGREAVAGDPGLSRSALGKRIHLVADQDTRICTIVGVVDDVYDVLQRDSGTLYVNAMQTSPVGTVSLFAAGFERPELDQLRRKLLQIAPHQAVIESNLADNKADTFWPFQILFAFFATLAALGISLAAVGTYAMLSHSVKARGTEFAVRSALGASPRQLIRLAVGGNLASGGIAIVLGLGVVTTGILLSGNWRPAAWTYPAAVSFMAMIVLSAAYFASRGLLDQSPSAVLRCSR